MTAGETAAGGAMGGEAVTAASAAQEVARALIVVGDRRHLLAWLLLVNSLTSAADPAPASPPAGT